MRKKTYIIFLGEREELPNLGGTLGTQSLGVDDIGDTRDVLVALLDNAESQNGEIHSDDATTNRFTLALTGAAGSVAGVAFGEEETDTGWMHDSLLHWETLLVVATGDLEDVAFEFIANGITRDFSAHSVEMGIRWAMIEVDWADGSIPLVHEDTQLSLIFDLDELLAAIGRLL